MSKLSQGLRIVTIEKVLLSQHIIIFDIALQLRISSKLLDSKQFAPEVMVVHAALILPDTFHVQRFRRWRLPCKWLAQQGARHYKTACGSCCFLRLNQAPSCVLALLANRIGSVSGSGRIVKDFSAFKHQFLDWSSSRSRTSWHFVGLSLQQATKGLAWHIPLRFFNNYNATKNLSTQSQIVINHLSYEVNVLSPAS